MIIANISDHSPSQILLDLKFELLELLLSKQSISLRKEIAKGTFLVCRFRLEKLSWTTVNCEILEPLFFREVRFLFC